MHHFLKNFTGNFHLFIQLQGLCIDGEMKCCLGIKLTFYIFYIFFNLKYFFRDPQKQSDILLDSDFGITSDGVNIIIAEDITPSKMYLKFFCVFNNKII